MRKQQNIVNENEEIANDRLNSELNYKCRSQPFTGAKVILTIKCLREINTLGQIV